MNNTAEDIFPDSWNTAAFATLGNGRNSFPSHTGPVIFDYIFYKIMKEKKVSVEVVDFASPQLKTTVLDEDTDELKVISLSDHEPVAAKFDVWKREVKETEEYLSYLKQIYGYRELIAWETMQKT